jgi:hypothetical protein
MSESTSQASFSLAGFQVTLIGRFWVTLRRKPGDYEPYGKRNRLMAGQIGGDCSGGCKVVSHPERTSIAGLGRLR